MRFARVLGGAGAVLGAVAARDLAQKKHALLRNYPVVAHARYLLETIGPELRQYIVTSNDEERPFSRDQRSWIYASSKQVNNYSGFGTDNDIEHQPGYAIIKHRTFADSLPHDHAEHVGLPSAKVLGAARGGGRRSAPTRLSTCQA
jgi:glutamate synthase domain-containing protein 2